MNTHQLRKDKSFEGAGGILKSILRISLRITLIAHLINKMLVVCQVKLSARRHEKTFT
jgi:hypothetical protein